MDAYDPTAFNGLNQTANQVGGNAASNGIGYGAPIRQANMGKQDAFQKLAMMRILQGGQRQKMAQDLSNEMQQYQFDQQKGGPLDVLGAGISGLGALAGIKRRDKAYSDMGIDRPNAFQSIFD